MAVKEHPEGIEGGEGGLAIGEGKFGDHRVEQLFH